MRNEIVLPAGTEYVATADIPEFIMQALHPDVTGQPLTVSYFIKFARPGATGETAKWNGWPIDDEDRTVLANLWADLPPLPDHATADEVGPYIEKANNAALDWTLDVCWNNPQLNSSIIRPEAERDHRQAIAAAIRRGDLKVVAPHSRLATDEFHPNSQVSVEELRRYVAQFKIAIRLESSAEAVPVPPRELATRLASENGKRSRDGGIGATAPIRQSENLLSRKVDFISLTEALSFIAGTLDVPAGCATAEDESMWRASEAAAVLHEHLNNAPNGSPRWFEVNETTGKPLVKDAVADEGMSILLHAAEWFEREMKAQTDHILGCVKAGIEPTDEPRLRRLDEGQWDYTRHFLREYRIGFARNELAELVGMAFGAVTAVDRDEARKVLAQMYARLDHIAWAMVILAPNAPAQGEARSRQILGVTNWLISLGLQFRTSGGLPANQPAGAPVIDMDVREYQYLAVADVRAAAISARCWPKNADLHGNVEGASPWGNTATQSVELPPGRIPATVLAYRIAMAFVDVPYGTSTEAWNARNRFEAVVSKHLDQMTDMARQLALTLVTAEGTETKDISVGYLSHGDAKAYLERYCISWSEPVRPPVAIQGTADEMTPPVAVDDRLEAMAEFVRTHVEEELRVQRIVAEFPEFLGDMELVNRAIAIGTARAQQSRGQAETLRSSGALVTPASAAQATVKSAGRAADAMHAQSGERITIEALGWMIAAQDAPNAAESTPDVKADNGLRRTLEMALRLHGGGPLANIAGVIPQIADLANAGYITVHGDESTTTADASAISAKPSAYSLTMQDAQHVLTLLCPAVRRYALPEAAELIAKRVHHDDYLAEHALKTSLATDMRKAVERGELPENERRRDGEVMLNEHAIDEWLARERRPYRLGVATQVRFEQRAMMRAGRLHIETVAARLAKKTGVDAARWEGTLVDAIRSGTIPLKNPRNLADLLPYPVPKNLRTFYDRVDVFDVNKLLDAHPEWRVSYRFLARDSLTERGASQVVSRPPLQQRHQENEILRVIQELGHDPKKLPKQKAGTAGVKSSVRQKLTFSDKVFNKAWQRLRDSGDIDDA